ncbi:MAG: hypothetical protein WBD20_06920 [Pirellulaceae bacterium]
MMQFGLRTLLISAIVGGIGLGVYLNVLRERRIERELSARCSMAGHQYFTIESDFSDERLIKLFEKYSPRADEPAPGNIAANAMYNLVIRKHPQGLAYAQQYLETDVSPLWQAAVYSLLYHHDLPDLVEGEVMEGHIDAGFERNTPLGDYILAGNAYWDFFISDQWTNLRDNWHDAELKQVYLDTSAALERVHPPVAKSYARIVEIIRETDADLPPYEECDELNQLSRELENGLTPSHVLRHLVRHPELRGQRIGDSPSDRHQ